MAIYLYVGFLALVFALLALDLGLFNRRPHVIPFGAAVGWTVFWIALALAFTVPVYFIFENGWFDMGNSTEDPLDGAEASLEYLTAYVVEKSLSLDNIFVIALIFIYFQVPREFQHRVLSWGILGALVMRGIMIAAGVALIHRFDWITYVFGALLLFTAVKLLISRHEKMNPEDNFVVRLIRRYLPVTPNLEGPHFFTRVNRKWAVTPLFIVLAFVETTDVIFAVDSIPAVFAVTYDPFIVFTSNIFAILGLRSLFFVLADVIDKFYYLKASLVFLLAYVAVKMLLTHHYKIPTPVSLAIILGILSIGIIASVIAARRNRITPPTESA